MLLFTGGTPCRGDPAARGTFFSG